VVLLLLLLLVNRCSAVLACEVGIVDIKLPQVVERAKLPDRQCAFQVLAPAEFADDRNRVLLHNSISIVACFTTRTAVAATAGFVCHVLTCMMH
jgi:hypothetical protein